MTPSLILAIALAACAATMIGGDGPSDIAGLPTSLRYGTLFATLMAIGAIAFRRIRARGA